MRGKYTLYIDQFGNLFSAHTVKELREQVGGGKPQKMYVEDMHGKTYHTGYVIGQHWLTAYIPFRQVA